MEGLFLFMVPRCLGSRGEEPEAGRYSTPTVRNQRVMNVAGQLAFLFLFRPRFQNMEWCHSILG